MSWKKTFSIDDARVFMYHLSSHRDIIIFRLMFEAGIKNSEIVMMKKSEIPEFHVEMTQDVEVIIENGKGKRSVWMSPDILRDLNTYIHNYRNKINTSHEYLFVSLRKNQYGTPLNYRNLQDIFKTVSIKTGMEIGAREIRNSYLHNLNNTKGLDPHLIMKYMSYKSPRSVKKLLEETTEEQACSNDER